MGFKINSKYESKFYPSSIFKKLIGDFGILKRKGKVVFVLLITASEKHKNKGITSGSSRECINAVIASHALVFSVP
jgi:hypothetical protein